MQAASIPVALAPVFQGWEKYAATYAPISYGMSDWGRRSVTKQASWQSLRSMALLKLKAASITEPSLLWWTQYTSACYELLVCFCF